MSPDVAWTLALGVLGALVGSFLATIVVRWPADCSVLRGRSACDACGRTLSAAELVPLASAAVLRGRCRHCGAAIDPRHWQVELACALLGALAGWLAPGLAGALGAAFGWLLVTLAAIDAAELWLPDPLVAALALTGVAGLAAGIDPPPADRLIGGAAGFASLWAIAAGYRLWRGREGMGQGDPKLFGAIGLTLGWQLLPATLLIASMVGLGVVLLAWLRGRPIGRHDALPFGTFLAIAAYPAWIVMIGMAP